MYMYGIHGVVDDTMMLRWWWESYRVLESWRCFSNGWLTWKPVYCNITVQVVTSTSRIEFPSFLPSFSTDPSHWSYVSIHSSGRSMRIDRDKINVRYELRKTANGERDNGSVRVHGSSFFFLLLLLRSSIRLRNSGSVYGDRNAGIQK